MSLDRGALARAVDEFWAERARSVYFPPAWESRLDLHRNGLPIRGE